MSSKWLKYIVTTALALIGLLVIVHVATTDFSMEKSGVASTGAGLESLAGILSSDGLLFAAALAATAFALYIYKSEWKKVVAYIGGIVVILVIWGLYKYGLLHGNVLYALYVIAGATYLTIRKVLDLEEAKYFRRFFLLAAFGVL